jgi:hypothetical protein
MVKRQVDGFSGPEAGNIYSFKQALSKKVLFVYFSLDLQKGPSEL